MKELLSKCCSAPIILFDNWANTNDRDDVRFTYVCSECKSQDYKD